MASLLARCNYLIFEVGPSECYLAHLRAPGTSACWHTWFDRQGKDTCISAPTRCARNGRFAGVPSKSTGDSVVGATTAFASTLDYLPAR